MRVLVMVKATKSSEAGDMPSGELLTEMGQFNESLVNAGIMKAGEGLKPSSEGVRIRFSGSNRTVTKGPFTATEELVAGYWLWEVDSMDEAVEWVERCPNPMIEDSDIEIRPLYEMEDFSASDPLGEQAEHEDSLRHAVELQSSVVQPYLFFSGQCEEALEFYERALAARIVMKMRFNESPEPLPDGVVPAGFENKIMHASFTIGQMLLMASDGRGEGSKPEGFRLALSVASEAICDRVFDALAEDGKVDLPLAKTFWSPRYGIVTDKFNVGWMVMVSGR